MRLQDITAVFHGIGARIRRDAIGYSICAICAVFAVILSTWASVLALLPVVGPVYAQLIVAGFFVLVILSTVLWLQLANGKRRQPAATAAAPLPFGAQDTGQQRQAQFAQLAMIVEAVLLGYSLSRRR